MTLSVYNPTNPVERVLQKQYNEMTGEWLSEYQCCLMTKSLVSLKYLNDWLENSGLLEQRVSYFFAPHMCNKRDQMVFLTHPLFLRDICENKEISEQLYGPITFITRPLAHYLFREYPIHMCFETSVLKGANSKLKWTEIGGFMIADGGDVEFDSDSLLRILVHDEEQIDTVQNIVMETMITAKPFSKEAVSLVAPGVFKIDDAQKELYPDTKVWDKEKREEATISLVEPGEAGLVGVQYLNGEEIKFPKQNFDERFVVV